MPSLMKRFAVATALFIGFFFLATLVAARTTLTQRVLLTEVTIDAPADEVWRILTDFGAYSEWNPQFQQASGVAEIDTRLMLKTQRMTLNPVVLVAEPEQELRWRGSVILPGLFDGEHSFILEPLGENRVRVVQREVFRGLLVPFSSALLRDTKQKIQAVNRALKARAEAFTRACDDLDRDKCAKDGDVQQAFSNPADT